MTSTHDEAARCHEVLHELKEKNTDKKNDIKTL